MKSYPIKFESFQRNIVQMGALQKLQNSIQILKILWPVYSIHTNSILDDVWIAIILPFPPLNTSILAKTIKFSWSFIWIS